MYVMFLMGSGLELSRCRTYPPACRKRQLKGSLVVTFAAIRLQGPRFKPRPGQKFENVIAIVCGGFCPRVCLGWFLSVPPCITTHLLQQKVKHHFKFHVS